MGALKPPRLRRGDVIGLLAPSSPAAPARIEAGVRYLEGLGYRVQLGKHLHQRHGFFAGTDAQRLEDLNGMVRDPRIRAIFATRGGYGTPRILPGVDYRALRRHPKILVGFSDFTALQLAVHRKTGLVTFSGPMAAVECAGNIDPFTEEQFWRQVTSPRRIGQLPVPDSPERLATLRKGICTGPLLGGNLAMVLSSLGTPFFPRLQDSILVLEELNESLHRVDRMFTQLRNAGALRKLAGLVIAEFTRCDPIRPEAPHHTLPEILAEVARWIPGPMAAGLPYGHVPRKVTLPWGVRARLDTARGRLDVLEGAVE